MLNANHNSKAPCRHLILYLEDSGCTLHRRLPTCEFDCTCCIIMNKVIMAGSNFACRTPQAEPRKDACILHMTQLGLGLEDTQAGTSTGPWCTQAVPVRSAKCLERNASPQRQTVQQLLEVLQVRPASRWISRSCLPFLRATSQVAWFEVCSCCSHCCDFGYATVSELVHPDHLLQWQHHDRSAAVRAACDSP